LKTWLLFTNQVFWKLGYFLPTKFFENLVTFYQPSFLNTWLLFTNQVFEKLGKFTFTYQELGYLTFTKFFKNSFTKLLTWLKTWLKINRSCSYDWRKAISQWQKFWLYAICDSRIGIVQRLFSLFMNWSSLQQACRVNINLITITPL